MPVDVYYLEMKEFKSKVTFHDVLISFYLAEHCFCIQSASFHLLFSKLVAS